MTSLVHKNQILFKKILKSLSYPGRQVELSPFGTYSGDLSDLAIELAMTLVDGEVSLSIVGEDEESFKEIAIRTNVARGQVEGSDFIIVKEDSLQRLGQTISQAKKGTYIGPDDSATIIVEFADDLEEYDLKGPGIDGQIRSNLPNKDLWLEARDKAVDKYPMGIDLIFVNKEGYIIGLPRTTEVKVVGE